jgi:anti-sigma factor RsiW
MDHLQATQTFASERYLLEEMTEEERQAFEAHYFQCPECADDVRAAALLRDGARASLASGAAGAVANVASGSRRSRTRAFVPAFVPWAAAATLAIVAGYQAISRPQVPGGGPGGPVIALSPVTLRAASRGAEAVVSPGLSGMVTLAVDLGDPAFASLEYDIRDADGRTVAHGSAPVPAGGAPLLLTAPSTILRPAERYVLTLKDPGSPRLTDESYRFRVAAQ